MRFRNLSPLTKALLVSFLGGIPIAVTVAAFTPLFVALLILVVATSLLFFALGAVWLGEGVELFPMKAEKNDSGDGTQVDDPQE